MKFIKKLFTDNNADVNLERMVAIAIAFVAGALMILGILSALDTHYASGMDGNIHSYLD